MICRFDPAVPARSGSVFEPLMGANARYRERVMTRCGSDRVIPRSLGSASCGRSCRAPDSRRSQLGAASDSFVAGMLPISATMILCRCDSPGKRRLNFPIARGSHRQLHARRRVRGRRGLEPAADAGRLERCLRRRLRPLSPRRHRVQSRRARHRVAREEESQSFRHAARVLHVQQMSRSW